MEDELTKMGLGKLIGGSPLVFCRFTRQLIKPFLMDHIVSCRFTQVHLPGYFATTQTLCRQFLHFIDLKF